MLYYNHHLTDMPELEVGDWVDEIQILRIVGLLDSGFISTMDSVCYSFRYF